MIFMESGTTFILTIFFTSKQLLCDLESVGTYGCGTARRDEEGIKKSEVQTTVSKYNYTKLAYYFQYITGVKIQLYSLIM